MRSVVQCHFYTRETWERYRLAGYSKRPKKPLSQRNIFSRSVYLNSGASQGRLWKNSIGQWQKYVECGAKWVEERCFPGLETQWSRSNPWSKKSLISDWQKAGDHLTSRLSMQLTSSTGPIKEGTLGLCSDPVWRDHIRLFVTLRVCMGECSMIWGDKCGCSPPQTLR